jgi:release factor glutamine methyltransferase
MTVLENIRRNTDVLTAVGVPSPRLEAELLLASVLKIPRLQLYLNFDRQLDAARLSELNPLLERRARREPLQYIVGAASFCGLELVVNENVLIPRSETELLAEEGWSFLNQLQTSENSAGKTALDLCTGSGCLAIALAVRAAGVRVYATDLSPAALVVARQNARQHGVDRRIEFCEGNLFAAIPAGLWFDLIVSNPPYVPSERIATLAPEVRDYEPRSALEGGEDGLEFYRRIAKEAGDYLANHGRLMLELDEETAANAIELFSRKKWIIEAVRKDYQQHSRILIAHLSPRCQ